MQNKHKILPFLIALHPVAFFYSFLSFFFSQSLSTGLPSSSKGYFSTFKTSRSRLVKVPAVYVATHSTAPPANQGMSDDDDDHIFIPLSLLRFSFSFFSLFSISFSPATSPRDPPKRCVTLPLAASLCEPRISFSFLILIAKDRYDFCCCISQRMNFTWSAYRVIHSIHIT